MSYTVGDLLRSSMRKLGILAAGEPLTGDEAQDALEALQIMTESWTTESLLIPVVSLVTKQLIQGQAEYTIGIYPDPPIDPETELPVYPDNHIETLRPEKVLTAFIRDQHSTDYELEIIDADTYARISQKDNASRPTRLYIRKGWPLNTYLFESTPYADETLHLEVLLPLSEYLKDATLTDVIDLPPGYRKALVYNLCMELSDEWGKQVSNNVAIQSVNSKKWLKRQNARPIVLGADNGLRNNNKGLGTYIINQGP